jgi:hypothetical protein
MARLPVIAAAVLAIAASIPVICTTTSPASAQGWRDKDGDMGRDLRDLLTNLRHLIVDLIQDRQDSRGRLRERTSHWRDREEEEDDGGLRGRLRERIAERIAERPVVARRETVISSPGACGTRTGICSSSFAGACVATEHGPEWPALT